MSRVTAVLEKNAAISLSIVYCGFSESMIFGFAISGDLLLVVARFVEGGRRAGFLCKGNNLVCSGPTGEPIGSRVPVDVCKIFHNPGQGRVRCCVALAVLGQDPALLSSMPHYGRGDRE
ncbi:hypothetical protein BT67DRAFT_151788 [Trichocladium antarcticum]|uniref:Uncharacterized protein n=1 Tax=Trichocladium antarcticum TaxID=1450529 RepID=A0AAN6UEK0_9PEZI|nr:hypothetical protein BT67DRAFT_151788 [Trichocladium antarcticum]